MNISNFLFPLKADGHLSYFQVLANNDTMNIHVQIVIVIPILLILGIYSGVELLSYVVIVLNFLSVCQSCFPHLLYDFTFALQNTRPPLYPQNPILAHLIKNNLQLF